jgi:hypothetical protein
MNNDLQEDKVESESSKKLKNLEELLNSFQNPEKRFIIGEDPKVTAFEFDQTFHHLFMGFKNGEVLLILDRLY